MCGIFGIINHHKRQLDKRAFVTLGCVNDSRGGDACGIMIDGKVEKGTAKEDQFFQDWYSKSKVLQETEKCYVALGHCRKASVGGVAPEKAQPVTIHDKDGKMLFCLIHNGTIYNYEELAKKYIPDIDIKGLTDSQVMAQIFYHKGYDVLAEYNGGGAFVIQDYRSNKTFLFKGESKGSYGAVKTEAERPLYFVKTGKSIIFSSIYAVLQGLYWGFIVYDVPSNVLMQCDGLALYAVKEYDRTKCYGCRTYTTTTTTPKKASKSYDDEYDDYYSGYGAGSSVSCEVIFDPLTGLYVDSYKKTALHGLVYISDYGYTSTYQTMWNKPFYFWRGIMLCGANSYKAVADYSASLPATNANKLRVINLARRLSCNPTLVSNAYCTYNANNKREYFSDDEYHFPMTKTAIYCGERGKMEVTYSDGVINKFQPVDLSFDKINSIVDYVKKGI